MEQAGERADSGRGPGSPAAAIGALVAEGPIKTEVRRSAKAQVKHVCSFPGIPARVDWMAARWQVSWLADICLHLPSRTRGTVARRIPAPEMNDNPLTVAGAASVLDVEMTNLTVFPINPLRVTFGEPSRSGRRKGGSRSSRCPTQITFLLTTTPFVMLLHFLSSYRPGLCLVRKAPPSSSFLSPDLVCRSVTEHSTAPTVRKTLLTRRTSRGWIPEQVRDDDPNTTPERTHHVRQQAGRRSANEKAARQCGGRLG
nr:hypothetical protein REQ54_03044 [Rhizobium sp. Q54]